MSESETDDQGLFFLKSMSDLSVTRLIRRVNRLEHTLNGGAIDSEKKDNAFEVVLKKTDDIKCVFKRQEADVFVTELDDNDKTFKRIIDSESDLIMHTKVTVEGTGGDKRYVHIQSPLMRYMNEVDAENAANSSILFNVANLAEAGKGSYQSTFNYGGSFKGLKGFNERAKKFVVNAVNIVQEDSKTVEKLGDLCAKLYARQPEPDMIKVMASALCNYGEGLLTKYAGIQKMCEWMPHDAYTITPQHGVQWNKEAAITYGKYEIIGACGSILIKNIMPGLTTIYQPLINARIEVKIYTVAEDANIAQIVSVYTNGVEAPILTITTKRDESIDYAGSLYATGGALSSGDVTIEAIDLSGGRIHVTEGGFVHVALPIRGEGNTITGWGDDNTLNRLQIETDVFNAFQAISPDARRQFNEMCIPLFYTLATISSGTHKDFAATVATFMNKGMEEAAAKEAAKQQLMALVISNHFTPIFTNYLTGVRDWQTVVNWEQNVLELATIQSHEITELSNEACNTLVNAITANMGEQVTILNADGITDYAEDAGKAQLYFIRAANNMKENLMLAEGEADVDYEIRLVFNDRTEVCDGSGEHVPPEEPVE